MTRLDRTHCLHESLQRWNYLRECLLVDIRLARFGYGIDLVFNLVWDDQGVVRPDVLERPILLTLRLIGLESMQFTGGLTDGMRTNPDSIDWGLSEIAMIEPVDATPNLGIAVVWEGERRLELEFLNFEIYQPAREAPWDVSSGQDSDET